MAVRRRAEAVSTAERIGGRYRIEAKLGQGGMGAVFRVRDEATDRQLALKCMLGEHLDGAAQLRFRREFHTMASLRHPRIVEVLDFGIADGVPYYTMELLDGQDLHDLDKIPWRRACELLRDVASALAFLHARRLLHRDLAPRNVRCTSDGRAKLIDFGVLATTGVSGEIAGTPPLMAPEALYGRPLDHRYDLYGLGALAYRILTGRHAFPARAIEELESAWRHTPPPPSSIQSMIPPALDELVHALLARDPLARPAGAAEVIDRLTVIGQLARPAHDVETARGWIASAALVGRQREIAQIRRAIARAHDGAGRSLMIDAPSGMGKTRLLRELALEAQLGGVCVVRSDSETSGRGPYGVLGELARGLLAAAPIEAEAAARPRAATLARVISSLRDRLGIAPAPPQGDPAEDRMSLQQELAAWVLDIAASRPIALLVDDVQRCDEASAAVLAALAHGAGERPLIIAVALRTDETVRAPAAIASLLDAGQRLRLRGLDESEVAELCRSLFGDVPHVPQLAHWMHAAAGGSPLHTSELARHLVDRGVVRYIDGLWTIPEDPAREDLPVGLVEAMDARVRSIPASARALGEALSVHGGELPLELVVALADKGDTESVFAALDQLAFDEILIQAGDSWRFRHDGLREALLRGLSDERRRELHRRVGEALAARRSDGAERDAEIGWHLLRGGDTDRGAERLERAGRALYDAQSFAESIPPLEAALRVREQRSGSARVRLELLFMLLMAGCMADRATALRYLDACVYGFRYWAGIDVATRARRLVGRHLGVLLGLCWAAVRWLCSPRRGPNPYRAFHTFYVVIGYAASVRAISFDLPGTRALVELAEPVAILKKRIPYAAYLLARDIYRFPRGDLAMCVRDSRRVLEILASDRLTPIREIDRRTAAGAAHLLLVMIATINCEPWHREELDELARLGLRFFDVGATQARMVEHRLRGEEEAAAALEAELELLFVQLGAVWQMQAFIPAQSMIAYGHTRDMLGLRRMVEELAARCAEGLCYDGFLALARGEYLRERGDVAAALAELEQIRCDDHPLMEAIVLPALAETLLALGDHARARDVAAKGLAITTAPETHNLHGEHRCTRALALAEAASGDHVSAARRLDKLLADSAQLDSPMLIGALHETCARVALTTGDTLAFHHHLSESENAFHRTHNAVLIARAKRLADVGRQHASRAGTDHDEPPTVVERRRAEASVVTADAVTTAPPMALEDRVSAVLSGCRGGAERATRALELVIEQTRGASGYLYLRRGDQVVLAAPAWGDEPPAAIAREVARLALEGSEAATVRDVPHRAEVDEPHWKPVPLVLRDRSPPHVIGAVAVVAGAMELADPDGDLVAAIARALFDAGDVTTTRAAIGGT